MEKVLNRLNIVLIVLVGGLVLYQWAAESRADAEIVRLRLDVRKADERYAVQKEALARANEDLGDFKSVVAGLKAKSDDADAQIRKQRASLFTLEKASGESARETEGLRRSLSAFKEALAGRDADIRTLLEQRKRLVDTASETAKRANATVTLYNDLAARYEGLVAKYNDLAKRYQASTAAANGSGSQTKPQDNPGTSGAGT